MELLVAITLLAVIAVIAWRGLDAMTRGSERLTDHDARLDSLKMLYGQFQADCERLASPDALQASPVEVGPNLLLLVRDRRDEGYPGAWQAVAYRIEGNTVIRTAGPLSDQRDAVLSSLQTLRQGGVGTQARVMVTQAQGLAARVWIEPEGWQADAGRVRSLLMAGRGGASSVAVGRAPAVVRGLELTLMAQMGDGDTPRQFQKTCLTGL